MTVSLEPEKKAICNELYAETKREGTTKLMLAMDKATSSAK